MTMRMSTVNSFTAAALLFLAAQRLSLAGSATWSNNPSNGDWNVAANWTPQTVPNSTSDVATFGTSNVTDVINTDGVVTLDSLVFNPGAPQYTINSFYSISLDGTGIANNSGTIQSFVPGIFFFNNGATAGSMTNFNNVGGYVSFHNSSSAGSAVFDLSDNMYQASVDFFDSSTAANATINATGGAEVSLEDNATGGNAAFTITGESFLGIVDSATADHASATCIGGDQDYGAGIFFHQFGSADEGIFTAVGASSSGEKGAYIDFSGSATAANATFVIGGGSGAGLAATTLTFEDTTTAATANITVNGGVGGSEGGTIYFENASKGGTATISLLGNGTFDISGHTTSGVTIGSLSGDGQVFLGANPLTIGSNNLSTTFSGTIQDGGVSGGSGGSLIKLGSGTLTLSGASAYTGGATVSAGTLVVSNRNGSATGTGAVQVNSGTLGGSGIISGAVTVNSGAFLAPAHGTKKQSTLTIQSPLTFNAGSTYTYTFKAKGKQAKTDKVIANGVTINSGANVTIQGTTKGSLKAGTVYTLISNTSANPISGTFSNLADGAIVNVNGNNLQASYEGGDGNDLTLTVVP